MSNYGWVSVHRSIESHWVWNCEFSTGQAWVDLIIMACHSDTKLSIKGQLITLKRGQLGRSEVSLASRWKWSRNKVRRFLKNLESDSMIEQQTTHLTSIITICNYSDFQGCVTPDGTTKGHQTEQLKDIRRNTNNNVNNADNGKNVKNKEIDVDGLNKEAWQEWVAYKKKIKSPYKTELSEKTKANELVKLSNGNEQHQLAIVRQSIENDWKGLFALKIQSDIFGKPPERKKPRAFGT